MIEHAARHRHRHAGMRARGSGIVERRGGDGTRVHHRERVAHQRHTGQLRRGDPPSGARQPARQLDRGGGLPGVHARPGDVDHRNARGENFGRENPAVSDVGRTAHAIAQGGEYEDRAQNLGGKRRAMIGVRRRAAPEDAAHVQHVDRVSGRDRLGHHAGVTLEGPPRSQRSREHVAGPEGNHPPRGVLDRVVRTLVVLDPHGEDVPLFRDHLGADEHLRRESGVARGRRDAVEFEAPCLMHHAVPPREASRDGIAEMRANARASSPDHRWFSSP